MHFHTLFSSHSSFALCICNLGVTHAITCFNGQVICYDRTGVYTRGDLVYMSSVLCFQRFAPTASRSHSHYSASHSVSFSSVPFSSAAGGGAAEGRSPRLLCFSSVLDRRGFALGGEVALSLGSRGAAAGRLEFSNNASARSSSSLSGYSAAASNHGANFCRRRGVVLSRGGQSSGFSASGFRGGGISASLRRRWRIEFRAFGSFGEYLPTKYRGVRCRALSSLPSKNGSEAAEKFGFDNIQELIVSPPSVPSAKSVGDQPPTLLEREAEALEGSTVFSRQERIEAMSGLLDHLEQNGVTPGYAFDFVRHAGGLVDDLFVEAQEMLVRNVLPFSENEAAEFPGRAEREMGDLQSRSFVRNCFGDSAADIEREKKIYKLLEISACAEPELSDHRGRIVWHEISTLASRVTRCAGKRELGRLVSYFQIIGMKAQNVPVMLPFLEQGLDMAKAKVDFLKSLGVRYHHLPVILESWPELLSYNCDSLVHNANYLEGLGLCHKDIGKMVVKFPQILGRDVEKELHKCVETLENLGVQVKDVKKLLVRFPVLLTENASEKLDPLVAYLERLGVRKDHIGELLLRRPLLLDSDVENDLAPMGNYLKSLNASSDDIDKILMSFPQLFGYSVDEDFRPTVQYLGSLGVGSGVMGKLFRRHPQLLKIRHNFEIKLDFLLSLGLEQEDLGKVIYNAPQLLGLSIQDNMEPTVEFLSSVGITGPSLLKILKLKPMVLAHSVEGKLKPNIKFLESLQIQEEEIAKMVARHPQLLTLSVEKNLRPTVAYLLDLGFTREEVTVMVKKLPSLLGFKVATALGPKYVYLVDVMKRSRKETVHFPHYFSYSLPERIIPRHQLLGQLCEPLSLNTLYACSDAVFERRAQKWMQRTVPE